MSQNKVLMNVSVTVPALFGLQRGRKLHASYMLLIYAIDKEAYIIMKDLGGEILPNSIFFSTWGCCFQLHGPCAV